MTARPDPTTPHQPTVTPEARKRLNAAQHPTPAATSDPVLDELARAVTSDTPTPRHLPTPWSPGSTRSTRDPERSPDRGG